MKRQDIYSLQCDLVRFFTKIGMVMILIFLTGLSHAQTDSLFNPFPESETNLPYYAKMCGTGEPSRLTAKDVIEALDAVFINEGLDIVKDRFIESGHISAGFKSKGRWVQGYVSAGLPFNLNGSITEDHLDSVEIVNGSLLSVMYDVINYNIKDVVHVKTNVIIGAFDLFDQNESRRLTSRHSIDNNYYISNSPRISTAKLEHWDDSLLREMIRMDSIWVEEYKLLKKE